MGRSHNLQMFLWAVTNGGKGIAINFLRGSSWIFCLLPLDEHAGHFLRAVQCNKDVTFGDYLCWTSIAPVRMKLAGICYRITAAPLICIHHLMTTDRMSPWELFFSNFLIQDHYSNWPNTKDIKGKGWKLTCSSAHWVRSLPGFTPGPRCVEQTNLELHFIIFFFSFNYKQCLKCACHKCAQEDKNVAEISTQIWHCLMSKMTKSQQNPCHSLGCIVLIFQLLYFSSGHSFTE